MEQIHPLKAFRDRHNPPLSQAGLGKLIGVSGAAVSRWETGIRKPELDQLPGIIEKTGIPASALRPDLAAVLTPAPPPKRSRGPARSRAA